jgi:hypothetical protein
VLSQPSKISLILHDIEARFKLALLQANPVYKIERLEVSPTSDRNYFRAYAALKNSRHPYQGDGTAEGLSSLSAQLRACAEAYEKICLAEFQNGAKSPIDTTLPYAFGVGWSASSARRRAWAEYYERLNLDDPRGTFAESIATPSGTVHICKLKHESLVGTGYGLSKRQAWDSALRSALRKKDLPSKSALFMPPNDAPEAIDLTPQQDSWLRCAAVFHPNKR